jgi:hypothetical protein
MRPALLGVVAVAVLLAGCSAATTGAPAPTTGTSTPTATDSGGAPKVAKPLNAAGSVATPCSSLTQAQLTNLGLAAARGHDASITGVAICSWTDDTTGDGIGISWQTGPGDGLATIYSERAQQGYWQPTTVDTYPAVFADIADLRSQGDCSLDVGVNDQLSFTSKYTSTRPEIGSKSCQLAQQAAADVIKNVGGA